LPDLRVKRKRPEKRIFKYSCFISCPNPDPNGNVIAPWVKILREDLLGEIADQLQNKKIFWRESIQSEKFIANALCESVCMIMLYLPTYFEHSNSPCDREFKGMETLEKQRLQLINDPLCKKNSLIIPILLRGKDEDSHLQKLSGHRTIYNFKKYAHLTEMSRKERKKQAHYQNDIGEIATHIVTQCLWLEKCLEDPCGNCAEFSLPPSEQEGVEYIPPFVY
jgi:hypothetical protein